MDKRHAPYRCQRTATNLARRVVTCPVLSKLVWVQSNIYTETDSRAPFVPLRARSRTAVNVQPPKLGAPCDTCALLSKLVWVRGYGNKLVLLCLKFI